MKRHSAWAVAAAILIRKRDHMHYAVLADKVIQSDLSGLGEDGGATPEATLGASLRRYDDIFALEQDGDPGFYYVRDREEALRNPKIKAALEALERSN